MGGSAGLNRASAFGCGLGLSFDLSSCHKKTQHNRNYLESIPFDACPGFEVAYAESEDAVGYTGALLHCTQCLLVDGVD